MSKFWIVDRRRKDTNERVTVVRFHQSYRDAREFFGLINPDEGEQLFLARVNPDGSVITLDCK